jgi:hypothetical protein
MKIHVLGYYDMSTGILESEDGRSNLLWEVGKYLSVNKALYQRKLEFGSRWHKTPKGSEVMQQCTVTPSLGK